MRQYPAIIQAVVSQCWAIMPEKMDAIVAFLNLRFAGGVPLEFEAAQKRATKFRPVNGNIAVIPIHGVIVQHADMFSEISGAISTDAIGAMLDAVMADSTVDHIIFHVDSPGGSVYGLEELSDKIFSVRGQKPMTAIADSLMASAAYYIGCAADEIIVTPGGEVGCIGTLALHVDESKKNEADGYDVTLFRYPEFKGEGNPYEPLTEEGHKFIQGRVREYAEMFMKAVARNRGTTLAKIKADYGEGRLFGAAEAKERGMVDRVATIEQVINDLTAKGKTKGPEARRNLAAEFRILKLK